MTIKNLLLISALAFSSPGYATTLIFDKAGFEISTLEAPPGPEGTQALIMMLPAEGGFAANVNVQIQPYAGSLADYKKLSESQFSQLGFKVMTSAIDKNILTFEYAGSMSDQTLHWYSRAIKKGNFIYLVTATSQERNWLKNKAALETSVNSFKLK
ncbi:MAG: hypothetical protein HYZ31_02000 [Gammaproteobacteria bacterium]|nr:hypothetical protein [Gammaproteobacteria bacterium]